MKPSKPPFHTDLFLDQSLEPNEDFRRVYRGDQDDHTRVILDRVEVGCKAKGLTFDEYVGAAPGSGYGHDILDWYANGPEAPADRPGMIGLFHPQLWQRYSSVFFKQAQHIAKALKRWVWIVECEQSKWYMLMLGGDPDLGEPDDDNGTPAWQAAVRTCDQYIAVISPAGVYKMLGAS